MEKTQEDTITESSSQLRLLIERQLAKEKIRLRQRHYRQMRRQRESELQQNYEQLKANFHALEINLHVVTKQSMMHAVRANEYKRLCEILINQMANQRVVSEGPSPGVECIEIDDTEEYTEGIINIPSYTFESNNEIKIHEATIQHENDIPSSFNLKPIDPEEIK